MPTDTSATSQQQTPAESTLLAAGRFAEYHLAKAKRLYAGQNYKEAAYQASASIAHGVSQEENAEAIALRKAAKAALPSA